MKTNKEKILKFAGKCKFDKEMLKEIKEGWKRWTTESYKKEFSIEESAKIIYPLFH